MLREVGHPVVVNPDAALARIAREEGWDVMRFERLGRRLKVGAAAVVAAAAGGAGTAIARRGRSGIARRALPPVSSALRGVRR
jgi:hypothetical protein